MSSTKYMFKSLCLAFVGAAAVGCAEPEPSMLIDAHVPFEGGSLSEGAIDTSGCSSRSFGDSGVRETKLFADLSVAVPDIGVLAQNRLVDTTEFAPIGTDEHLGTDSNSIAFSSLVATFDPDGPYAGVGDGGETVYPIGGLLRTNGDAHLATELVTPDLRSALRSAANAAGGNLFVPSFVDLQLVGETTGGENVESNVLTMPIEFCDGCLTDDPSSVPSKFGFATFFCRIEAE